MRKTKYVTCPHETKIQYLRKFCRAIDPKIRCWCEKCPNRTEK